MSYYHHHGHQRIVIGLDHLHTFPQTNCPSIVIDNNNNNNDDKDNNDNNWHLRAPKSLHCVCRSIRYQRLLIAYRIPSGNRWLATRFMSCRLMIITNLRQFLIITIVVSHSVSWWFGNTCYHFITSQTSLSLFSGICVYYNISLWYLG